MRPSLFFRKINPTIHAPMNRPLSFAILIIGVILLVYGISAHDSLVSSAKEAVTGTPTDKSLWLIVGGIAGIIVGGFGAFFRGSNT